MQAFEGVRVLGNIGAGVAPWNHIRYQHGAGPSVDGRPVIFYHFHALTVVSPEVIVLAAYVLTLQSFAVHANVDVELGWLGYVVMAPAHHRLHHSTKLEEAGNFASAITLWDLAFGTFVYGRAREPMQVGVTDPTSFPSSNSVIQNQLHPFVDQSRG